MKLPSISVVTPSLNRAGLIKRAIGFIALMVEEGGGVDDIAQAEANEHQS